MFYLDYSKYHAHSQASVEAAIRLLRDFERAYPNAIYRIGVHDHNRPFEAIRQVRQDMMLFQSTDADPIQDDTFPDRAEFVPQRQAETLDC